MTNFIKHFLKGRTKLIKENAKLLIEVENLKNQLHKPTDENLINIKNMISEFREWDRSWNNPEKKPKTRDEFTRYLSKKYTVKQITTQK